KKVVGTGLQPAPEATVAVKQTGLVFLDDETRDERPERRQQRARPDQHRQHERQSLHSFYLLSTWARLPERWTRRRESDSHGRVPIAPLRPPREADPNRGFEPPIPCGTSPRMGMPSFPELARGSPRGRSGNHGPP